MRPVLDMIDRVGPSGAAVLIQKPMGSNLSEATAILEICRAKNQVEIPEDLRTPYFEALAQLPETLGDY